MIAGMITIHEVLSQNKIKNRSVRYTCTCISSHHSVYHYCLLINISLVIRSIDRCKYSPLEVLERDLSEVHDVAPVLPHDTEPDIAEVTVGGGGSEQEERAVQPARVPLWRQCVDLTVPFEAVEYVCEMESRMSLADEVTEAFIPS